jgi:hypothetical protein
MVRPDRLPRAPMLLLGMMLLMIFTAWCATPPGPTEQAMTLQQLRSNRDFEVSAAAIHCTHDVLSGPTTETEQVGARSGGPLPGPILPRGLMDGHDRGSRTGRHIKKGSHSQGEVLIRPLGVDDCAH